MTVEQNEKERSKERVRKTFVHIRGHVHSRNSDTVELSSGLPRCCRTVRRSTTDGRKGPEPYCVGDDYLARGLRV